MSEPLEQIRPALDQIEARWGDPRTERGVVGAHIGVVGRDIAAARHPVIAAADQQQQRHDQHHESAQPALVGHFAPALDLGCFVLGDGAAHRLGLQLVHGLAALFDAV